METILKQELNIDKTNWKLVKFGDVAFEPKETMKDIVSDGIDHVVGLEHITSGDIHLRNSNSVEESTTFTKKFSKGDVLFGRRRAYLKKAAVARTMVFAQEILLFLEQKAIYCLYFYRLL